VTAPEYDPAVADTVQLTVPADAAYVSVLRTVTASLAARRDFTIEEIDDLRIAVDEASSLLLPYAAEHAQLSATFTASPDSLSARVAVPVVVAAGEEIEIDTTSFAWMVLAALADTVATDHSGSTLSVTLTKARGTRAR
jgi:serine/threonine-protein kinase RsbW